VDFASIPWVQGSLVTIVISVIAAVAGMVYKGLLVPKPTHDALIAVMEQRITEKSDLAAEYKAAWQAEQEARREQDNQIAELMEYARTTDQFIRSALGAHRDEVA
jgi:hypothetical protein